MQDKHDLGALKARDDTDREVLHSAVRDRLNLLLDTE